MSTHISLRSNQMANKIRIPVHYTTTTIALALDQDAKTGTWKVASITERQTEGDARFGAQRHQELPTDYFEISDE